MDVQQPTGRPGRNTSSLLVNISRMQGTVGEFKHGRRLYIACRPTYVDTEQTYKLDVDDVDVDVDLRAQANASMPASYIANYIY